MDVLGGRTALVLVLDARSTLRLHGLWRINDFHVQPAAEWNHMRDDELAVGLVLALWQERCELLEAECCKYGEQVDFVSEIKVELLIRWEGLSHAVQSIYHLLATNLTME